MVLILSHNIQYVVSDKSNKRRLEKDTMDEGEEESKHFFHSLSDSVNFKLRH